MKKDDVFKEKLDKVSTFSFDQKVVQVFDDMVFRSIPMYKETQTLTAEIISKHYQFKGIILDLGCSIGRSIYTLAKHIKNPNLKIVGVDSSKFMVQKCEENLSNYRLQGDIKISQNDILTMEFKNVEIFIMHYTLQFIPYVQKEFLIQKIYDALPQGSLFIFSEKLQQSDDKIENWFTQIYFDFKRKQGYSELEIAQKRESLENVLEPLTYLSLEKMLQTAGFSKISNLCQYLNFGTFLAIK